MLRTNFSYFFFISFWVNLFSENNCIAAGHIHVGGYIPVETSIIAVEETVRTLINYLEEFISTLSKEEKEERAMFAYEACVISKERLYAIFLS